MLEFRGKPRQVTSVTDGSQFGAGGDFRHLELKPENSLCWQWQVTPGLARAALPRFKKVIRMSSRTGNWMIAVGAVALVLGLVTLPAALGEHVDTSLLTLGACWRFSRFHDRSRRAFISKPATMKAPDGSDRALGRIQELTATSPGWLRCMPRRPASDSLQGASSPPLSGLCGEAL